MYREKCKLPWKSCSLDEIQECPDARTALKFFHLDGRYDVIGTGSLLGVRGYGKEPKSIPVGYETTMDMSPLDFEEFLWAVCRKFAVDWRCGNTKSTKTILAHPEKYHVNSAIKLGDYNVGRSGEILTLPLYMAFLLTEVWWLTIWRMQSRSYLRHWRDWRHKRWQDEKSQQLRSWKERISMRS